MKLSKRRKKQHFPDFMYETGVRHTIYTIFGIVGIITLLIVLF